MLSAFRPAQGLRGEGYVSGRTSRSSSMGEGRYDRLPGVGSRPRSVAKLPSSSPAAASLRNRHPSRRRSDHYDRSIPAVTRSRQGLVAVSAGRGQTYWREQHLSTLMPKNDRHAERKRTGAQSRPPDWRARKPRGPGTANGRVSITSSCRWTRSGRDNHLRRVTDVARRRLRGFRSTACASAARTSGPCASLDGQAVAFEASVTRCPASIPSRAGRCGGLVRL